MRLILVDDHELVVQGLARLLAEAGHEVVATAGSGRGAVEALERNPCDMLLLDLGLPDGTWTAEIRRRHPALPILVLTMHADESLALAALRAGANGYLVKYAGVSQLRAAVEAVATGSTYVHADVAASVLKRLREPEPEDGALSERELEVLRLLARGRSNPEIARALNFSLGTIKATVAALFARFGVQDRTHLALEATKLGFLPAPSPPAGRD